MIFFEIRCIAQAVVDYCRPPASTDPSPSQERFETAQASPRRDAFPQSAAPKPPIWQQTHAAILRDRLAKIDAFQLDETWEVIENSL